MRIYFIVLLITFLFISCTVQEISPTPTQFAPASLPSTASEAHDLLIDFLTGLHTKQYAEAVPLYGGEYEQLQVFNPEIDPNDKVALWIWVCDNQLLQCLEVRSTTFKEHVGDSYVFQVELPPVR